MNELDITLTNDEWDEIERKATNLAYPGKALCSKSSCRTAACIAMNLTNRLLREKAEKALDTDKIKSDVERAVDEQIEKLIAKIIECVPDSNKD